MRNPKQQLLRDLLEDANYASAQARLKTVALAEFRRAQWRRRCWPLLALAAAGAVLLALSPSWFAPKRSAVPVVNQMVEAAKAPAARTQQKTATQFRLSDEELVASFPSNSCFLAEVDGRKVLVFTDPEVRKQYVH